jgi:hypothetical protein
VRDLQALVVDAAAAVENDVQVEGPRAPALALRESQGPASAPAMAPWRPPGARAGAACEAVGRHARTSKQQRQQQQQQQQPPTRRFLPASFSMRLRLYSSCRGVRSVRHSSAAFRKAGWSSTYWAEVS